MSSGQGVEGTALLDIGAGVGIVHLALLEAGAATAVDVDASRDYLAAARAEAEQRGLADRMDYRYGDVVELAAELPPADIATLAAVICCYRVPARAPASGRQPPPAVPGNEAHRTAAKRSVDRVARRQPPGIVSARG